MKRQFGNRQEPKKVHFTEDMKNCTGCEQIKTDLPGNFKVKEDDLTSLSLIVICNSDNCIAYRSCLKFWFHVCFQEKENLKVIALR
jgi:hypothetical protein